MTPAGEPNETSTSRPGGASPVEARPRRVARRPAGTVVADVGRQRPAVTPSGEAPTAPPRPTTPAQRERVERMLEATLELLDDVGPQGLAVRDVAARADVALGTLYRYFPSKDVLVASALEHWGSGLVERSRAARDRGTVEQRLTKALRSIARSFAAHPNYATASVLAASSTDPLVPPALDAHRASFAAGIDTVLGDLPGDRRSDLRFVIEAVLIAQLVGFSSGRTSAVEVEQALLRAAGLFDLSSAS